MTAVKGHDTRRSPRESKALQGTMQIGHKAIAAVPINALLSKLVVNSRWHPQTSELSSVESRCQLYVLLTYSTREIGEFELNLQHVNYFKLLRM